MNIIEFISQPWHWSVSGVMIVLTMFLLLYTGREFGVSSTLRTMCSIAGAGKKTAFFNFNWKNQIWNIVFTFGAIIGGFIASHFLQSPEPIQISEATITHLESIGIASPQNDTIGNGYLPPELFNLEILLSVKGILIMVVGGFFIGFGTRWAGGCTSGHAISGLANLQLPSLIAVIGFFIGGLLMTHLLLPIMLNF